MKEWSDLLQAVVLNCVGHWNVNKKTTATSKALYVQSILSLLKISNHANTNN